MIRRIRTLLLGLVLILAVCLASGGLVGAAGPAQTQDCLAASSPPSSVLPYVSDGDVWLVDTKGFSSQRVTDSGHAWGPSLSPDGTRLAFWGLADMAGGALHNDPELWVLDLKHPSASRWPSEYNPSPPGVGWRPALALQAGAVSNETLAHSGTEPDLSKGHRRLIVTGPGPVSIPSWSPDGQQLAWIAGDQLVVADLDGETRTLATLEVQGIARPEVVWSPDGRHLICSQVSDGTRGLWSVEVASGMQRLLAVLSPDGPVAYAFSPEGTLAFHQAGTLQLLLDFGLAGETVAAPDAEGLPRIVTQLAWSGDGSEFALVGSDGGVYIARTDTWARRRLSGIAAFVDRVRWLGDGDLACWGREETSARQALFVVSPVPGEVTRLSPPGAPVTMPGVGEVTAGSRCAEVSYDWYRYQGEWDSGAMAHSNCGPTCVAMAIQYARDNLWVPISSIRDYMGGSTWTYPSQLQSALDYWGVPNQRLYTMQDIHDAVALRGSIVLVHLWMYWITPGSDYLVSYSDPLQHHGRYYSYDQSHWVVFKGISPDGLWGVCHDPNAWDGNGLYWYGGGAPKGKDRYYLYDQLAGSITEYGYQAIEVYASASPTETPTLAPTSTATPTPAPTGTATLTQTPTPTATYTPPLPTPPTPDPYPPPATPTATLAPSGNAYVNGSLTLQGRPSPPHSRWIVLLDVTLLQGGAPVAMVSVLTDDSGNFCVGPFTTGTYDVRVKNFHTLSNLRQSVMLAPGSNSVHLGELREGDANGDNVVDIDDFGVLKYNYGTVDSAADFNQDGIVDIDDFGWLKENFGQMGDVLVAGEVRLW